MFIKKTLLVAALIAAICLVTTSALTSAWAMPTQNMPREPDLQRAVVEGYVRRHFKDDADIMLAVAECESTGLIHIEQKSGKLRPNRGGSGAAGVFQLMLPIHAKLAAAKGYDVRNNLEHYILYVHHLYLTDKDRPGGTGLRDWHASRWCWSGKIARLVAERSANENPRPGITEVAEAKN